MCFSAQHVRLKWTQETPQPLSLGFWEHQVATPVQGHLRGAGSPGRKEHLCPSAVCGRSYCPLSL